MTYENDYVWITPMWIDELLEYRDLEPKCMELMLEGTFFLHQRTFFNTSRLLSGNETIASWRNKLQQSYTRYNLTLIDNHVGFAYDSVTVFAKVFRDIEENEPWLLGELSEKSRRKRVSELIESIDFEGVSGRVKFDETGNRNVTILASQWVNGGLIEIGSFEEGAALDLSKIWWANGEKPSCVTRCHFIWAIKCEQRTYYRSIFFVLLLVLVVFATLLFWYKKKMRKLKDRNERGGLMVDRSIQIMPKDLVRDIRLGSGEFGEVWGGKFRACEFAIKATERSICYRSDSDFFYS